MARQAAFIRASDQGSTGVSSAVSSPVTKEQAWDKEQGRLIAKSSAMAERGLEQACWAAASNAVAGAGAVACESPRKVEAEDLPVCLWRWMCSG